MDEGTASGSDRARQKTARRTFTEENIISLGTPQDCRSPESEMGTG